MTAPEGDISTFAYNPVGQLASLITQRSGSDGVQTAYTYDGTHRLTAITHTNAASGSLIRSYDYDLDLAGNRTHVLESDGINQQEYWWSYDAADRLTSETYPDGGGGSTTTSYAYDPVGNRLTETTGGQTTTYTYNNRDQLTQTNGPSGIVTYDYDGRGNLWREVDGMDVTTFSYDARDRLSGANLPDGTTLAYAYNHDNQRIQQTINGNSTNYLWDELSPYGDVVAEFDENNVVLASYALAEGRLLSQNRGGVDSYYLSDAQSSTRLLTDLDAVVTDTYDYSAFGEAVAQTGTTINFYRYTAQQYDSISNLYYLRARYYAPGLGRFLSRDTWSLNMQNPVEWNRYVYTANNPINLRDPGGNIALLDRSQLESLKATVIGGLRTFGYRVYGLATRVYVKISMFLMRRSLPVCVVAELFTDVPLTDAGCGAGLPGGDGGPAFPGGGAGFDGGGIPGGGPPPDGGGLPPGFDPPSNLGLIDIEPTAFQVRIDPETGGIHPLWSVDTTNFSGSNLTASGGKRDPRQFWRQWLEDESLRPVPTLSDANVERIRNGTSPIVDDLWTITFPEHQGALASDRPRDWTIVHHHVNQGLIAIPVPQYYHTGRNREWHPR